MLDFAARFWGHREESDPVIALKQLPSDGRADLDQVRLKTKKIKSDVHCNGGLIEHYDGSHKAPNSFAVRVRASRTS